MDEYFLGAPPDPGGLAAKPPMGWNSWNTFSTGINATLIEQVAQAIVDSGMKDAGYTYINLDDGWSEAELDADGNLQPSQAAFPEGIKSLADGIHGMGLKLGVYGDRGTKTCANRAGSEGNEARHAEQYAAWGVDYLKHDNCNAKQDLIEEQYRLMADSLKASGRDIVFSICAWSFYEWALGAGHLWRTTGDIEPTWESTLGNALINRNYAAYAGPNSWNDPDMLEVGNEPATVEGAMTLRENRAHFSLWAISAAPLIAGNDPRRMSDEIRDILTNREVIALNQDPLGLQAAVVVDGEQMLLAKPLYESGARGVVLLNRGEEAVDMTLRFRDVGLGPGAVTLRDLWEHQEIGTFEEEVTLNVRSHEAMTLKLIGNEPLIPQGDVSLSDLTWTYAANGLGPVERDRSNGSAGVEDGAPLSIAGEQFDKGLGVAGPSLVIYRLGQNCSNFTASVGIDDSTQDQGSVTLEVWGDDDLLWESDGVVTAATGATDIDLDVSGKHRLKLKVLNGGDGSNWDRVSWGNAELHCAD
jgi:alpha-galactosidase